MVHCFVENIIGGSVIISGQDAHHITNVLRMKVGDEIYVSDESGRGVVCSISGIGDDGVTADIIREEEDRELPVDITLYQSLPKGDKMEFIIQKCTELGVRRIVPVESSRCVVKLDSKSADKKVDRWQKLARSASEQSQRNAIMEVAPVMSWKEALKAAGSAENAVQDACAGSDDDTAVQDTTQAAQNIAQGAQRAVICFEHESGVEGLKSLLTASGSLKSISIFVGPEGGYSDEEVTEAAAAGITPISLGRRILRTETAGMALAAAIMLNIEAGR